MKKFRTLRMLAEIDPSTKKALSVFYAYLKIAIHLNTFNISKFNKVLSVVTKLPSFVLSDTSN